MTLESLFFGLISKGISSAAEWQFPRSNRIAIDSRRDNKLKIKTTKSYNPNPMFTVPQKSIKITAWAPLLAIVICGLALRIFFATGIVRNDEVNYAHAAYELASGNLHLENWSAGTTRIGLYLPTAILYALFGAQAWTTHFFSFFSSLLGIFVIYLIGSLIENEKTGLIAALLWAVFPLDVYQAGTIRPDGPMATFCAVSIFFFLLAIRPHPNRKYFYFGFSLFFLGWALAIKPIALILAFFYIFLFFLMAWSKRRSICKRFKFLRTPNQKRVAQVIVFGLIGFGFFEILRIQSYGIFVFLSQTSTDAARLLFLGESNMNLARGVDTSLFFLTSFLLLISVWTLAIDRNKAAVFPIAWMGFSFVYYEWGSISPSFNYFPIFNYIEARTIEFVLVPAILIVAIYLARGFTVNPNKLVIAICTTTLIFAIVLRLDIIQGGPLPGWFYAIVAIGFGLSLLSPFFISSSSRRGNLLAAALLLTLSVSSLLPTPPYHISYWAPQHSYRKDLAELGALLNSREGLVYVPNVASARDVNLGSNFQLGFAWAGPEYTHPGDRILIGDPRKNEVGALVIRLTPETISNWKLVREFDNSFQDLFLYIVER